MFKAWRYAFLDSEGTSGRQLDGASHEHQQQQKNSRKGNSPHGSGVKRLREYQSDSSALGAQLFTAPVRTRKFSLQWRVVMQRRKPASKRMCNHTSNSGGPIRDGLLDGMGGRRVNGGAIGRIAGASKLEMESYTSRSSKTPRC